ncbi:MAG: SGNH/GDSL hydrolase family protein [Sciscionella sp.]
MARTAALAVALVTSTAVAVPAVASAAPTALSSPTAAKQFTHYVALGDSYTAGPLIPFPRLDRLFCAVSTNNYPAVLASTLGTGGYTDASCSGADSTDMTASQSLFLGSNPPQFDSLQPSTDLVTIGIGGNDFSVFGDLTGTCPQYRSQNPTGSPCKDHYTVNGVDTIKQRLVGTQARLIQVLSGIHQRSPLAKVVLVGYLRIAPPTGTCPNILPFADGDLRWLDSVEQALNSALANAARADGNTTFVDTYGPSLGHDACAPGSAAWIQGKDINFLGALDYHPRRAGMVGVATFVRNALAAVPASSATEDARVASQEGGN